MLFNNDAPAVTPHAAPLASGRARILNRLRSGPALASELAAVDDRWYQHINDLREAGAIIEAERAERDDVANLRFTLTREAGR